MKDSSKFYQSNRKSGTRFGTATAMQPRGMFIETLNQGMLEAAMHGYYDFWMRKNIFEKKAVATAAK